MLMFFHAFRRMAGLATLLAVVATAGLPGARAEQTTTDTTQGQSTSDSTAGDDTNGNGAAELPATESATDASIPPPAADAPECEWIGQRILSLLWRDDIDTAREFMVVYDRFGCPGPHLGPAFRCLVKVGVGAEDAESGLPGRSKACWANPDLDPASLQPKVEGTDSGSEQQGDGQQGDGQNQDQQNQNGDGQQGDQPKQEQQSQ